MNSIIAPPVSLRTKLFYGAGSIAYGVKDNGFQTILLLFYNQVVHLPAQLVGAAIFIALIFDAFIDPVIGQVSDNLRTRWGRRHPLMYLSAFPVAVSYLLLWNPPHWSQGALFVYLVVVAVIVRTFITFYEIPSSALAPELAEDYHQRTALLSYRTFFAWFGGLTMLALAYLVFLRPDAAHPIGQLNEAGYRSYGITAAIVMFVAILVSAAGTHRFIPGFRAPQAQRRSVLHYGREMFATLANRSFLILMLASLPFNLATGLVFALNIYLLTYFWELSNVQIFVITFSNFLAVILAFLVALPLSRRFGKKRGAIAMFVVGLCVGIVPLSSRLMGIFPANGTSMLMPLLFVFSVVSLALTIGSSILMVSMLSDVVEDSELRTGRRSEGLFFAGNSFMQKAVTGLGLFASGLVLRFVNFPSNAVPGHVDPDIVRNLALVYVPLLMILYGVSLIVLEFYPITRESHEETLQKLAAEVALAAPETPI